MTMTIMIIITVNIVNIVNNTKRKCKTKIQNGRNSGARGQEIDGFSLASVKWSIEQSAFDDPVTRFSGSGSMN